jgi:signal transduction histidine kinase
MAGSQTDITEHKQILHDLAAAKAAADTASSAKSAFLATMSHELRTPLTAILGYSEMLEEYAVEKGVVDALPEIQRIHRAGNHLRDLINDVLNLSKVESGKMEIYVEPFLILDVVNDVAATVQPLIEQGGNCLKIEHASKLGLMYSDQTKLRQVLLNLLGNAAKFTSNGTVCLRITRSPNPEDDVVCFEITDTGIGMSQEQIDRLFQPFVQADVSITRRYGGTGLGLALSQRFCQLMGGNVTVTSQEGVGTTFLVQIPAQIRETSAQSASEHILTN